MKTIAPTENKYLHELKNTVLRILGREKIKIVLFGSRAGEKNNRYSDVDLGLIPRGKIKKDKVALLKEKIDNLNIPYKVDVVDFSQVSEDFKKMALRGAVVWKR